MWIDTVKPPHGYDDDGSISESTILIRTWFEKSETPAPLAMRMVPSSSFTAEHEPGAGNGLERANPNDRMARKKLYSFMFGLVEWTI